MNLFKSLLSESDSSSPPDDNNPTTSSPWSFTDLIKTVATKSGSVIGSYRRDFEEFGSELKKETSVIRQVASRAVEDLPDSLEIAQESLESVGQAIDDIGATVWKSTAKIISHGKESLLSSSGHESSPSGLAVKPYNRFEMQLLALQSDKGTYVREPDDLKEFENWGLGFRLEEKGNEIVDLVNGNEDLKAIYEAIVPVEVDSESFWRRYFYKVYKLEKVEEARVKLVKRAISGEEDEDLSWDLDDEGDETTGGEPSLFPVSDAIIEDEENEAEKGSERGSENAVSESREVSSKDSDISVISTQPSLPEVEDLGWDKMEEDIRSNEDKSLKSDWRRRVIVGDEEDDLTWDIEDEDDESAKQ